MIGGAGGVARSIEIAREKMGEGFLEPKVEGGG